MFGMGPMEMFLALIAILLLFGAKRIPEIAGSFGKGIREFKRNMSDVQKEIQSPAQPTDALPSARVEEPVASEPKRLL
jgi:sec-independent protein translocase protein TatA